MASLTRPDLVANQTPGENIQHADCKYVATSVHITRLATHKDVAKMESVLEQVLQIMRDNTKCAANPDEATMLADGLYVPWREAKTRDQIRDNCRNYFQILETNYRLVNHKDAWKEACIGMNFDDAHAAAGEESPPLWPAMEVTTFVHYTGPAPPQPGLTLKPRPLMSIDLVGLKKNTYQDKMFQERSVITQNPHLRSDIIGCGRFSLVYRGRLNDHDVAIKVLKLRGDQSETEHVELALKEVVMCEKCAGHPHIIQLLDVAKLSKCRHGNNSLVLVFEMWGRSAETYLEEHKYILPSSRVRCIAEQCLKGLEFLHSISIIHTDVKLENILVACCAQGCLHTKLADLGSCLISNQDRRPDHKASWTCVQPEKILDLGSEAFRAPEVIFGNEAFDCSVDMWSFGMSLGRLAGLQPFTVSCKDLPEMLKLLCKQIGSPQSPDVKEFSDSKRYKLFKWYEPIIPKDLVAQRFPENVCKILGRNGVNLLSNLLSWRAATRQKASACLQSAYFHPTSLSHAPPPRTGETYACLRTHSFTGARHFWNMKEGEISPAILAQMQNLVAGVNSQQQLRKAFHSANTPLDDDDGDDLHNRLGCPWFKYHDIGPDARQYIFTGRLTSQAHDRRVNNMDVERMFPVACVNRWRSAFIICNKPLLDQWHSRFKRALLKAHEAGECLGSIGEFFLKHHYNSWLLSVGEGRMVHRSAQIKRRKIISKQSAQATSHMGEKLQFEGAASALHLCLTIAGCCTTMFLQEAVCRVLPQEVTTPVASDVFMRCTPGHVYITSASGARHRVIHDDAVCDDDLVFAPSGGPMSFCVILRCCVFSDVSRYPVPKNIWMIFCSYVRELISDSRLRLPSDDEFAAAPSNLLAEDHLS